ncbi:MAG: nucleotide exchange factor GrpE [Phycisphaerae bacterium]
MSNVNETSDVNKVDSGVGSDVELLGEATAEPMDELSQLRAQVEELKDKHVRALAEQRNMQARNAREREEALRYAESDLARELLVVVDNLERTIAAAGSGGDAKTLIDGVKMVHEQFLKVLRGRSVEPIVSLHQPFDPNQHEALMHQPSSEHEPGTVVMEIERGYRMRDRVIRPARVAVAKAP